jgi:hypothetical protein
MINQHGQYNKPCPLCGVSGHPVKVDSVAEPIMLACPQLPEGSRLIWNGMTFTRDNHGQFPEKQATVAPEEFPEYEYAEDFFDANQVIFL